MARDLSDEAVGHERFDVAPTAKPADERPVPAMVVRLGLEAAVRASWADLGRAKAIGAELLRSSTPDVPTSHLPSSRS